jgi:hypothetical protein
MKSPFFELMPLFSCFIPLWGGGKGKMGINVKEIIAMFSSTAH